MLPLQKASAEKVPGKIGQLAAGNVSETLRSTLRNTQRFAEWVT